VLAIGDWVQSLEAAGSQTHLYAGRGLACSLHLRFRWRSHTSSQARGPES